MFKQPYGERESDVIALSAQRYEEKVQKTGKRFDSSNKVSYEENRSYQRHTHARPEIVSTDVLAIMLDDDLAIRLRVLEDSKNKLHDSVGEAAFRPWEEEIAYVRREQQIRRIRRESHAKYVQETEEEFNRSEAGLPAGDFDNTVFVNAATGGRPRFS